MRGAQPAPFPSSFERTSTRAARRRRRDRLAFTENALRIGAGRRFRPSHVQRSWRPTIRCHHHDPHTGSSFSMDVVWGRLERRCGVLLSLARWFEPPTGLTGVGRSRSLLTVAACHRPPRAGWKPMSSSALAIPASEATSRASAAPGTSCPQLRKMSVAAAVENVSIHPQKPGNT